MFDISVLKYIEIINKKCLGCLSQIILKELPKDKLAWGKRMFQS